MPMAHKGAQINTATSKFDEIPSSKVVDANAYLHEGELFLRLAQLFPKSGRDLIQQANGQSSPLHDNLGITAGPR